MGRTGGHRVGAGELTVTAQLVAIDGGWRVEGDINYRTVVALREAGEQSLLQAAGGTCRFDFSTVEQVNTAALALLLCWRRKAEQQKVELHYVAIPSELMAIAKMSDLASLFKSNGS